MNHLGASVKCMADCPCSVPQDFLLRLYKSPLITICAIRGACPAGGCILSLLCDSRIMTEAGTIGLNEVALGIPVPYYWVQAMCQVSQRFSFRVTDVENKSHQFPVVD